MSNNNPEIKVVRADDSKAVVVNNLVVQSVDRTPKDITKFMNALKVFENVNSPNRAQIFDLYKYVELDPFYSGVWNKRVANILNKKLCFKNKDGEEVEEFEPLIKSGQFRDLLTDLMNTITYGRSGYEFIPGKEFMFYKVPRKHIDLEKKKINIFQSGSDEGYKYQEFPNIWILGESNDPGIMHKVVPYVIYKRNCLGDYSQFIEIFGIPIRVIRYDANDDKTKQELRAMASEAGSALTLEIPKQAEFEILDGKGSGNATGDLQSNFIDLLNKEIAIYILGNVETSMNSNTGSLAKAKVQSEGQSEILAMDMATVLIWLNDSKFKSILESYGYPASSGEWTWEEEVDNAWLKDEKTIDDWFMKYQPLSADYLYEKYNRPKPDNYEELVTEMETEQEPGVPDPKKSQKKTAKPGEAGNKKTKPPVPGAPKSAWYRLRHALADFFDPAPKE